VTNPERAIFCHQKAGPIFGNGAIFVPNNFFNSYSSTNEKNSYFEPNEDSFALSNENKFLIIQLEAYSILFEQYKIHCVNLIKARLKGIVTRKKINKKLETIRKAKNLIFKHILSLRTILILKSSAIQNLLCDIAKIKYQLKNGQNEKCKELRNKLHKNINLFYDTYF
jgi:hypothetical protein